jgi:hypothetical protein
MASLKSKLAYREYKRLENLLAGAINRAASLRLELDATEKEGTKKMSLGETAEELVAILHEYDTTQRKLYARMREELARVEELSERRKLAAETIYCEEGYSEDSPLDGPPSEEEDG